jgi:hypothetical protein
MATVYSRIIKLQGDRLLPFKINATGIIKAGYLVNKKWRERSSILPDIIRSIEENGTFLVANYPDDFIDIIDQTIFEYANRAEKKYLKNIEKAKNKLPPPSLPPDKKKRKRIPISPIYSSSKKK